MNNQIKEEGLTNAYLLGKYDGIKQGRTEAIDECIKFIKDHSSRAFIDSDGWGCTDNDREDIFKLFWLDDLEKLKEQNETI